MKNLISFVTLSIFLLTTAYYMIVTEAKEESPDPVLDTDGDELRAGNISYLIEPLLSGTGGGLVAEQTKGLCEFSVNQELFDHETGDPLIFLPAGFEDGDVVRESTDLNIGFFSGCRPSNFWKVDDYNEPSPTKQRFIMLGGNVGNPGKETVSNWFKIKKTYDDNYRIVFCPSVCESCTVACSDIGIYTENGKQRLALSGIPFLFQFKKAKFSHNKY